MALGEVVRVKVGVSGPAPRQRQVLRTMRPSSSNRVRNEWTIESSSRRRVLTLCRAACERLLFNLQTAVERFLAHGAPARQASEPV